MNNRDAYDQRVSTVYNDVHLLLEEDIIHDKVNARTKSQKASIRRKRNTALVISFFVLIIGWCMIYLGSWYEEQIQDYFLETTGNEFYGEWSATIIMTFVNYFIPWLISLVDHLEDWDFAFE